MNIRRISFYGGPCVSKSTISAQVFCELKKQNRNIELISEFAKDLAYSGVSIKPYMQLQIFAEQVARETRVLISNPETVIVTDSPVLLSIVYAQRYSYPSWKHLVSIARDMELEYPSLNFFLERGDCPYSQTGRYETLEEAKMMDNMIYRFLEEHNVPLIKIPYNDPEKVLRKIDMFLYQESPDFL